MPFERRRTSRGVHTYQKPPWTLEFAVVFGVTCRYPSRSLVQLRNKMVLHTYRKPCVLLRGFSILADVRGRPKEYVVTLTNPPMISHVTTNADHNSKLHRTKTEAMQAIRTGLSNKRLSDSVYTAFSVWKVNGAGYPAAHDSSGLPLIFNQCHIFQISCCPGRLQCVAGSLS